MRKKDRTLSSVLEEARKQKELTIRVVADFANISHPYYCSLEKNREGKRPTKEVLKRIAKVLSLDFYELCFLASIVSPITNKSFKRLNSAADSKAITDFYCISRTNNISLSDAVNIFKKALKRG